jgi:diketogulonate reductase-like aldo/keto reductase
MSDRFFAVHDVHLPRLIYGTAWKEDNTQPLTDLALRHGFRGVDTANQRRHYDEAAVGRAVRDALAAGVVRRDELFLQTKFTFRAGQDHRLPYDPAAPIAGQVRQSFLSSLEHLGVDRLDAYLLHGPSRGHGLGPADWEAWQAMEALQETGGARLIGVSNVSLDQLQALWTAARVRPHIVQNRCYASRGWDREVRLFCAANGLAYQGFSLLTANRAVLAHPEVARLAAAYGKTPSQIVFRFALDAGMVALTGTTDPAHMQEDLAVFDFRLTGPDVARIEGLVTA